MAEKHVGETLHLNLKRKWFDMILSGEKKEEYRDVSEYWMSRLTSGDHPFMAKDFVFTFKHFDTITFSNGYDKDRPQFVIELKRIVLSFGDSEWGAEFGKEYFVLRLGKILKRTSPEKLG